MTPHFKALILDLEGVLLDWNPQSITALSLSQLRLIMHSTVWHDLDRGHLSLDQACEVSYAYLVLRDANLKIHQQFSVIIGVKASVVKESLEQAQKSFTVNEQLVQIVQELKGSNPDLQIYVMSNISRVRRKSELEHTTDRNRGIFKSCRIWICLGHCSARFWRPDILACESLICASLSMPLIRPDAVPIKWSWSMTRLRISVPRDPLEFMVLWPTRIQLASFAKHCGICSKTRLQGLGRT